MSRHPEWLPSAVAGEQVRLGESGAAGLSSADESESRARWLAGLAALLALWLASGRLAAALPVAQWVAALSLPLVQLELPALLWRFALLP